LYLFRASSTGVHLLNKDHYLLRTLIEGRKNEHMLGLRVRRLGEFNLSLLEKWCWRLLVDKAGLWYRVLKARYGEEGGRIQGGGRNASG